LKVDTLSMVLAIPLLPEVIHRPALHTEEDAHGNAVGNQRGDDTVAGVCKVSRDFLGEDAEVEEDN
jgi:hypothetical protein